MPTPDGLHTHGLQPLLHELVAVLAAPTQVWSGRDGQVRPSGAQGVYLGDVRVLSQVVLTVGGTEPEPVSHALVHAGEGVFVGLARELGDRVPDPTVRLERRRRVAPGRVEETVRVLSSARSTVSTRVRLALACDLAPVELVKTGRRPETLPARAVGAGVGWGDGQARVLVEATGALVEASTATATAEWDVTLAPGGAAELTWRAEMSDDRAVVGAAANPPTWRALAVRADDNRLASLVRRSMEDLEALRMAPVESPDQAFVAAGAPWFLTLFGRDALWAARLLLPLGTDLAGSTLRVLASRQGRDRDVDRAEEPGKIMHELRRTEFVIDDTTGTRLPPLYFGTVDATPLWLCLLHDAWRWGLPADEVAALLPHAEAALQWMAESGDADGDGLLEYVDTSGHGLSNQGWKDSGDSVQWRDGRLARAPIALCEVQGYAHEAAVSGAALLDAFGRPGADRWRAWARRLAERFRGAFWVEDGHGAFPGVALDDRKRPVDSLTSNIGHLLGTGLLAAEEEAAVVRRLTGPDMVSGFGLRTMSTTAAGYAPLSYHGGAVWPHDTAIVLLAMARTGHVEAAATLLDNLLAAGEGFDYRLPELFSGDSRAHLPSPVPYPAACRPQGWAAAAGVGLLSALLGAVPDAPAGLLRLRPLAPSPVGALEVSGLRLGGEPLAVAVSRDGEVRHVQAVAPGVRVETPSTSTEAHPAGLATRAGSAHQATTPPSADSTEAASIARP